MAATASQTNLAGLPRRLVQDGIVAEDKLAEATEGAKKAKVPLVAYLVNESRADDGAVGRDDDAEADEGHDRQEIHERLPRIARF